MRAFVLLLSMCLSSFLYSQTSIDYFRPVEQLVKGERSFNRLYSRLDSLKSLHMSSRSGISLYLNRDLDVGYTHKRISLSLNFYSFLLDFITRGDSICFTALTYNEGKHLNYYEWNNEIINNFLAKRNKLYGSKKGIVDVKRELTYKESFATHCGDGAPLTEKGEELYELVEEENLEALREMTKSISPEIQAYGVLGLELLEKREVPLRPYDTWIVNHLKKRDTDVVICAGCLDGIVTKLYSKK